MASIPDIGWGDPGRIWWRVAVALMAVLAWPFGSAAVRPPLDFETAHQDLRQHVGVVAGLLAAYLAIAVWPRKPSWSPEIVTLVGVIAATMLYWSGLITYEYAGHVHQFDGVIGLLLLAAGLVMGTYVRPPQWLADPPHLLVVGVVAAGLALGAYAEHRSVEGQRVSQIDANRAALQQITF